MVEVLVRQHHVGHLASDEPSRIGLDRGGLREGGAGVDDQRAAGAAHQPDRDVAERQPTAMDGVGQPFPREVHTKDGNSSGHAAGRVGKS
jgi:hypothetical protein